ncbi:MAG: hypothetical protein Unbinned4098contig1000_34 [Prokaryotic dsDNA virus sp.]|nr:MAG: hypothetical protein Unbinned4098contig1000_34 [Prokaryotic dsDNA virus sp.]|tara:strand:- start:14028 stop:14231 length:204 start_codon:yes stop_codon:yes gene_type:complete
MVNIKNINPLEAPLQVEGRVVDFGDVIDVPKNIADNLISTPNFEKASLSDAKKKKESNLTSSNKKNN